MSAIELNLGKWRAQRLSLSFMSGGCGRQGKRF